MVLRGDEPIRTFAPNHREMLRLEAARTMSAHSRRQPSRRRPKPGGSGPVRPPREIAVARWKGLTVSLPSPGRPLHQQRLAVPLLRTHRGGPETSSIAQGPWRRPWRVDGGECPAPAASCAAAEGTS